MCYGGIYIFCFYLNFKRKERRLHLVISDRKQVLRRSTNLLYSNKRKRGPSSSFDIETKTVGHLWSQ